jgi:hypothetical protein
VATTDKRFARRATDSVVLITDAELEDLKGRVEDLVRKAAERLA